MTDDHEIPPEESEGAQWWDHAIEVILDDDVPAQHIVEEIFDGGPLVALLPDAVRSNITSMGSGAQPHAEPEGDSAAGVRPDPVVEENTSASQAGTVDETRPRFGKSAPENREYPTAFGKNIDRLRRECGWSFNTLSDKTKLDKKLILNHVNRGTGARPFTAKLYADVFSEALGREVLVKELYD